MLIVSSSDSVGGAISSVMSAVANKWLLVYIQFLTLKCCGIHAVGGFEWGVQYRHLDWRSEIFYRLLP